MACSFISALIFGIVMLWCGTSSYAVPTVGSECAVHPIPEEVIEHLLTAANASLRLLQDKELEGQDRSPSSVSSLRETLNLGSPPDLLVLLLHTMEREQAKQDRELSRLRDELSVVKGRSTEDRSDGISDQDSSATTTTDSVLRAIIDLQMDVRALHRQQQQQDVDSGPTITQRGFSKDLQADVMSEATTCYPVDRWPHDCYDVARQGKNESGVYTIYPHRYVRDRRSIRVWCDFDDDGDNDDGWTVVLSRRPLDEQVNFNRIWRDYRMGFGDPETEHWIGNDALHDLTNDRPQILRVEMADWDGNQRYAEYRTFLVEDEDAQYRLHLGQYSGNAGTSFDRHDNMRFSTSDRDNDIHSSSNCAVSYHGGFWYDKCHGVSPTSLLLEKQKSATGITWHSWYSDRTTLKEMKFKLKPKPCDMY